MKASPELEEQQPIEVLLVEDDDAFRSGVERLLREGGFEVVATPDATTALARLEGHSFDVLLVDVHMPGMSGDELLEHVKSTGDAAEIVMMSGSAEINVAVSAVKAGAFGFLTKPFVSYEAVLIELRKAAQAKRLRDRAARLQAQLLTRPPRDEILGSSAKMRHLLRLVSGVTATDSTILVLGESGTGKELVARAIHERSRRCTRPFVSVNCGALPSALVESELFGHARGAFTSAVSARGGLFDAANGGTLLLDEIGDLPMSAQVKLLRVLEEGEIKPVGSDHTRKVDVRVIAATNVDLKAATIAGRFRPDLYYRLNVVPIHLPPLRERGDDVLLLAHHFLQRSAQSAGRPPLRLSDEAAERLLSYAWPGNVRELAHAMEHAIVFSSGDVVPVDALPADVLAGSAGRGAAPAAPPASGLASMDGYLHAHQLHGLSFVDARLRVLSAFTDAYVAAALKACDGNISEAARRSGVDRSNFRRLMRAAATKRSEPE
jgi:DNA-binding NtrC family response regulator